MWTKGSLPKEKLGFCFTQGDLSFHGLYQLLSILCYEKLKKKNHSTCSLKVCSLMPKPSLSPNFSSSLSTRAVAAHRGVFTQRLKLQPFLV